MRVAVCTLFRNCVNDVLRTFRQREEWKQQLHSDLDIIHICLEGDSTDDTYEMLKQYQKNFNMVVLKEDTGKPHYPSHVIPDRLITLGRLSNIALERAMQEDPDYILWLDSDAIVQKNYIDKLIANNKDVVAPMFFFENSTYFRDTWGYRAKGDLFTNGYPYCKSYRKKEAFEVDSVGLPLIHSKVIKAGARFGDEEIVDLCRSIKSLGFKIYVDPTVIAMHPRGNTIVPPLYEK